MRTYDPVIIAGTYERCNCCSTVGFELSLVRHSRIAYMSMICRETTIQTHEEAQLSRDFLYVKIQLHQT